MNPSLITPHREKIDHRTILFGHAQSAYPPSSVQNYLHPTWEISIHLPRVSPDFSPAVTLMAFARENKSFGSPVQDQTFVLTNFVV